MSKQIDFLKRCIALNLQSGGLLDLLDRIEELERDLLNLVCRIHRDGGHYIAKYGEAKAIADADIVAAQNNADLDILWADRDEWKARAEFSYKQRDELEREIERKMSAAAFVLKERDALLADNVRLREALEVATKYSMLIKDAAIIQCALAPIAKVRKP